MANFSLALESELAIIPVLNKIDLKSAQPEVVAQQMYSIFGINTDEILKVHDTLHHHFGCVVQDQRISVEHYLSD